MPWCDSVVRQPLPQLAGAGLDQSLGDLDRRVGHGGIERGLAELGLELAFVGLAQALADVLAQLVERVEAGGVRGEVVVEVGELLGLDLLDGDGERGVRPARASAP